MSIPRNAPCPCGSGLKYKKCCGAAAANVVSLDPVVAVANAVKRADMELHGALMRYIAKRLGNAWFREALAMFIEDAVPGMEEAELELAVPWIEFHCPVSDTGDSVAGLMAFDRRAKLTAAQESVLLSQLGTRLSIWQVNEIEPGVGFSLTDLLTGATAFVHEVRASHTVSVHLAMLARVVECEGIAFIAGVHPRPLTPRFADRAVTSMRKYFRVRTRPVKPERLMDPDAHIDMLNIWRMLTELQSTPPEIANTDGDPLALITDRFDFPSARRAAVIAALGTLEGADPVTEDEEGTQILVMKSGAANTGPTAQRGEEGLTVIARIEIEKSHLLVETNSVARANVMKSAVTTALGTLARYRIREEQDVQQLIEDARDAQQSGLLPPPPESSPEMDEMMRQFSEEYMQRWLDDNIPALGGLTPKQAAADPKHHAALKSLLREMEYHENQAPAAQRCDMVALRAQLGM